MMLLSALGLSLTMVTSTEERVADSYSTGSEAFYAADAAVEFALQELSRYPTGATYSTARRPRRSSNRSVVAGMAGRSSADEREATALRDLSSHVVHGRGYGCADLG